MLSAHNDFNHSTFVILITVVFKRWKKYTSTSILELYSIDEKIKIIIIQKLKI